jgi:tol-pal system protein YbgF
MGLIYSNMVKLVKKICEVDHIVLSMYNNFKQSCFWELVMNKYQKYLYLFCANFLFIGCAGSIRHMEDDIILPQIDVVAVKESTDEALKLAQEAKLEVDLLSAKVTELENRMIVLSEEVSNISSAKIEELENRISLLIEAYKDLHAFVKTLEGNSVRSNAKNKKGPSKTATFSPASAASLITSPEYEIYQNGLRVFNRGNYDRAIEIFADLLNQYPSGKYADNSNFWIGESYYSKGDFSAAIASFNRIFSFNKSSKSDDAQFKIGLSYLKMNQPQKARKALQELIDRYPSSEYAQRSKKYLSEIK